MSQQQTKNFQKLLQAILNRGINFLTQIKKVPQRGSIGASRLLRGCNTTMAPQPATLNKHIHISHISGIEYHLYAIWKKHKLRTQCLAVSKILHINTPLMLNSLCLSAALTMLCVTRSTVVWQTSSRASSISFSVHLR